MAPWAVSGYGLVTRELVPRIAKEGHEVIIATKHHQTGCVNWKGFDVISGMDVPLINRMVESGEVDHIISLIDNHILSEDFKNWVSYCPFDSEKLPSSIERYLDNIQLLIALTRHGQDEFKKAGYDSSYAPHGVDPDIYKPHAESREYNRKSMGWENNFVIGTVGVNYPDDRKNFVNLMWAFKVLHERHPEARLFMCTNRRNDGKSHPLPLVADNLGIMDCLNFTSDDEYAKGKVTDSIIANRYRVMDIMCLPTRGEGFGLPLIEAQACGTPIVTTNASTGPELLKGGWLIDVGEYEWEYFNKTWRSHVGVETILKSLEEAYSSWKEGSIREIGRKASEIIRKEYNWDYIFETCWKPILKEIANLKA